MRSRCAMTWLSGLLSVRLTCDVEWQWQIKRFQRVFCGWATCWNRTHEGPANLPWRTYRLWSGAATSNILWHSVLQHAAPLISQKFSKWLKVSDTTVLKLGLFPIWCKWITKVLISMTKMMTGWWWTVWK